MEKVINLLSDIEEKANKILLQATEEKAALYEELNQQMALYDQNVERETRKELDLLRAKMDEKISSEVSQMSKNSKVHLAEIEENFKTNHDAYMEQIFQNIINS